MGFSKNQIRVFDVLKTPSQNILVNAGAGSGKTTVLKKRVTNLLINGREAIGETIIENGKEVKGFHIDEIMVLTFTNEAAKSMKDKIIESINEAIENGHEELKEELSRIDEAIISTFDSYFSKFVKKYSSYSKIPSNFQTGDTSLFKMKETEIVEDIFNEHFAKGYNSKSLNEFDEFINIYGSKLRKNKAIEQVVSCYDAIQKEIDVNKYLNDYFKHYDDPSFASKLLDIYISDAKPRVLDEKPLGFDLPGNGLDDFYNSLNLALEELSFASNPDDIINALSKIPLSFARKEDIKGNDKILDWNELKEEYKKYKNSIKVYVDKAKEFKDIMSLHSFTHAIDVINYQLNEDRPLHVFVIETMKELHKRLNEYKKRYSVYSFDDITRETLRILNENEEICQYFKKNIKEILVDEYQDTNDIQIALLDRISNNNLVVVGDVKQCIYQFRNSNPENFNQKLHSFVDIDSKNKDPLGRIITLKENYRSRCDEVLKIVNEVFSHKINIENGATDYFKDMLAYGNKVYDDNNDPKNHFQIINIARIIKTEEELKSIKNKLKEDKKEKTYVFKDGKRTEIKIDELTVGDVVTASESEGELIASDIINRLNDNQIVYDDSLKSYRKAKISDFMILTRNGGKLDSIKKAFEERGLPIRIVKEEEISSSEEVTFLVSSLKLVQTLDNLTDKNAETSFILSLSSILRSFVLKDKYGDQTILSLITKGKDESYIDRANSIIPELMNQFMNYKNMLHTDGISNVIDSIVNDFNLYQKIESLHKVLDRELKLVSIIDRIKSYSKIGMNLTETIEYLKYASESSKGMSSEIPDFDNLNCAVGMTIHKSKGLERPIVYIADCENTGKNNDKSMTYFEGFGLNFSKDQEGSIHTKIMINKKHLVENEEGLRLVYVALTRARESVSVLFSPTKPYEGEIEGANSFRKQFEVEGCLNDEDSYRKFVDIIPPLDKKEETISSSSLSNNIDYVDINLPKMEQKIKAQASEKLEVLDENLDSIIAIGEEYHECMRRLNFISPYFKVEGLIPREFYKYAWNFKKQSIFNGVNLREFHELPYYLDDENGQMDYVLEKDDRFIIVDFKKNNLDNPHYIEQLSRYKRYLSTRTDKIIDTYLYSIERNELKDMKEKVEELLKNTIL